ncbi:hypothetical protein [Kribbella qitaiheensis]|nr:hypothetical protein [Kribbella qitaiheensis]
MVDVRGAVGLVTVGSVVVGSVVVGAVVGCDGPSVGDSYDVGSYVGV